MPFAMIAAAPAPWATRAMFSHSRSGAAVAASDDRVNTPIPARKRDRRPHRSDRLPTIWVRAPVATIYVTTTDSAEAPSAMSALISGRPMATIVRSTTTSPVEAMTSTRTPLNGGRRRGF